MISSMRCSATRAHSAVLVVDDDLVDDLAPDERLEARREVRLVDAEHRRARAHQRVERHDRLVGVLGRHPLDHVDLGADADHRARGRRVDPLEDALGGPDPVGELDHLVLALGVDDHLAVGVLGAERGDVLGLEALVDRAVAAPQEERAPP